MKFEQYIFNQGAVINNRKCSTTNYEKFKSVLPIEILELWNTFGFSGISNGLFTLTNPDDYKYFKNEWESVNNVLALKDQEEYLVGRSAFGDLLFYVIKENGKQYFSMLNVLYNKYEVISTSRINKFFERSLNDKTFVEFYFSENLFNECLQKLGPLEFDECYGFVPLPVLGGDKSLEYAQKVKMNEYLIICAQSQK